MEYLYTWCNQMRKTYEAWSDEVSITFADLESLQDQRSKGLLPPNAKLLHRVEADTLEEALAVHHVKMGFAPFVPMGDARPCPNNCGATYYPEGSGECPNCGPIG